MADRGALVLNDDETLSVDTPQGPNDTNDRLNLIKTKHTHTSHKLDSVECSFANVVQSPCEYNNSPPVLDDPNYPTAPRYGASL